MIVCTFCLSVSVSIVIGTDDDEVKLDPCVGGVSVNRGARIEESPLEPFATK